MPHFSCLRKTITTLLCASAFLTSCKSNETTKEPRPNTFSDYQSAETWIKQNHKAETITPDSSLFKKIEFYSTDNTGYLICYLHKGKVTTLIYQNIDLNLWNNFKNADSKGQFYNEKIQGKEGFMLELEN